MYRYIYAIWEDHTCFCFIDTKHYNFEQKMDLEIRMRDGTTKLLTACRNNTQKLEAIKSLMVSNERIDAFSIELNRQKLFQQHIVQSNINDCKIQPSRAKVSVSDIRIPLMWKDSDHFKNKGDHRKFSVFCLLKSGCEIYDTALVHDVDRSLTDITFDDSIVLNDLQPEFEVKLEVYSCCLSDDLSMASTPKKLRKKISSSVSRTFGRKLAAAIKEELNEPTSFKFELMASALFKLQDADDSVCTYDLKVERVDNKIRHSQLPLFDVICCRFAVQPYCMSEEVLSGYLIYTQAINGNSIHSIYWSSLINFCLFLWSEKNEPKIGDSDSSKFNNADIRISIDKSTKIKELSDGQSFCICDSDGEQYQFSVLNNDDLPLWLSAFDQHIKDHNTWSHVSNRLMAIPIATTHHEPHFMGQRFPGSLYDEISF